MVGLFCLSVDSRILFTRCAFRSRSCARLAAPTTIRWCHVSRGEDHSSIGSAVTNAPMLDLWIVGCDSHNDCKEPILVDPLHRNLT